MLHEVRDRVRARNPETAGGDAEIAAARPDAAGPCARRGAGQSGGDRHRESAPRRPGQFAGAGVEDDSWRACSTGMCASRWSSTARSMACVDAAIEALTETNRALGELGGRLAVAGAVGRRTEGHPQSLGGLARRVGAQAAQNEMQFLRSVADLQGGFQHRVDLMDANYRDLMRSQHTRVRRRAGALQTRHPEEPVGGPGAHPAGLRAADPLRIADDPPARPGYCCHARPPG